MNANSGYQGWKNYETWAVALWLDNEEGSYNTARQIVKEGLKDGGHISEVANALKEFVEGQNPLSDQANLFSDLLNAALSEVDWLEVAEHYKEDE